MQLILQLHAHTTDGLRCIASVVAGKSSVLSMVRGQWQPPQPSNFTLPFDVAVSLAGCHRSPRYSCRIVDSAGFCAPIVVGPAHHFESCSALSPAALISIRPALHARSSVWR